MIKNIVSDQEEGTESGISPGRCNNIAELLGIDREGKYCEDYMGGKCYRYEELQRDKEAKLERVYA